ncbi:MAG: hypothetical protein HQM15_11835 [Deltaproteobacteria bacterium]|nr:hypothetical protein [Deltaproteobacteria bacterium]
MGIIGVNVSGGHAAGSGGGIRVNSLASLTFLNGNIENNYSSQSGGGIYADFLGGTGLIITNANIRNNTADQGGGGLAINNTSNLVVERSSVSRNTARNGGGISFSYYNSLSTQDAQLTYVTLSDNTARESGGAISASSGGSICEGGCGGIGATGRTPAENSSLLNHVTIANNTAAGSSPSAAILVSPPDSYGATFHLKIKNSIVAKNGVALSQCDGTIEVQGANSAPSCSMQGGQPPLTAIPLLGILQLNRGTVESVALNAGSVGIDLASETNGTDATGSAVYGGRADLGAYEYNPYTTRTASTGEEITVLLPPLYAVDEVTIHQGSTQTVTVGVSRSGMPSASNLYLNVLQEPPVPSGLHLEFSPNIVPSGSTSSVLSLQADSSTHLGVYPLRICVNQAHVCNSASEGIFRELIARVVAPTPASDRRATAFDLTLNPSFLVVRKGQSGSATVTIEGPAPAPTIDSISVSGSPANVTAQYVNGSPGHVDVAVAANATPGEYPITVSANIASTPASSVTATLTLRIPDEGAAGAGAPGTSGAPTVGYSLAATPSPLQIQAGQSGQVNVAITRMGGHTAPVGLSVTSGLPSGVTAAFNTTTGDARVLTIQVPAGTSVSTSQVRIHGVAETLNQDAEFTLNIVPPIAAGPGPGGPGPSGIGASSPTPPPSGGGGGCNLAEAALPGLPYSLLSVLGLLALRLRRRNKK